MASRSTRPDRSTPTLADRPRLPTPPRGARPSARPRRARPPAPRREPPQQAEQPQVDGVRAAGGEGDLVGPHAQRVGRGLPRVVEQQPRLAPGAVQPARVGVPPVERRQEHLARRRVQRRRGRAVEVGGPGRRGSHRGNLCHAQPPPCGRTDPDLRRSADTRPCPARRGQMGILSVCREGPRERLVSGSASPQPFRCAPEAHPEGRAPGRDDAGAGRMFRGRHAAARNLAMPDPATAEVPTPSSSGGGPGSPPW